MEDENWLISEALPKIRQAVLNTARYPLARIDCDEAVDTALCKLATNEKAWNLAASGQWHKLRGYAYRAGENTTKDLWERATGQDWDPRKRKDSDAPIALRMTRLTDDIERGQQSGEDDCPEPIVLHKEEERERKQKAKDVVDRLFELMPLLTENYRLTLLLDLHLTLMTQLAAGEDEGEHPLQARIRTLLGDVICLPTDREPDCSKQIAHILHGDTSMAGAVRSTIRHAKEQLVALYERQFGLVPDW